MVCAFCTRSGVAGCDEVKSCARGSSELLPAFSSALRSIAERKRVEPAVVVGAAIAGQDALVVFLGGGGLGGGGRRFGQRDGCGGRRGLEPAHVAATRERCAQHEAKRGRRSPAAASFALFVLF